MKLGIRLSVVADMAGQGESMADIGSDHALLPIWMLKEGKIQRAIAGELGKAPFLRAQQAAQAHGCSNTLEVRQGDGLQVLRAGEVETVVIAGMGGDLMVQILQDSLAKSTSFSRYILQPMKHEAVLRRWLSYQGWQITEERLIYENEKYYVAMEVLPGKHVSALRDLEILLGAKLLYSPLPEVQVWLQEMRTKYMRVLQSLRQSRSNTTEEQYRWQQRIAELDAILQSNQPVEPEKERE